MTNAVSTSKPRREQILEAAALLFAANGFHNVTTRHIAAVVGISQPSLYAHFPNRDAIAAELCCRALAGLQQRLARVAGISGTPAQQLRRLGFEYIAFGLQDQAAYRIGFMLELSGAPASGSSDVVAAGLQCFAILRRVFGDIHGAEGAAVDAAAQSAWASLHGLVAMLLARRQYPLGDIELLISTHLDRLVAAALRPVPASE